MIALLDDACARTILTLTNDRPMSATELIERCDPSRPTVYRRLDELTEAGLLAERTRLDPDGDHHREYVARLDRFCIELGDDGLEADLRVREHPADKFTRLFEDL